MTTPAGNAPHAPHAPHAPQINVVHSAPAQCANELTARYQSAQKVVRHNAYWALGAGLIPLPVVDIVALTAVQVKMLKELSDTYKVKFFEDKAKKIISALTVGVGAAGVGGSIARQLFRLIPVVGQIVGTIGIPLLAGSMTMAVGNLFIMHYESGGTLLDFDPEKMRSHFQQELAKAKETVGQMAAAGKPDPGAQIIP